MGVNRFKIFFENRGVKQSIFKNTAWLFVSEGVGKIFTLLLVIYAARILGATEFGVFSFALALVGLFIIFAHFGILSITTRELTRDPENREIFPAILSLKVCLSVFTLFLIMITAFFFTRDSTMRMLILILALYALVNDFFLILYSFLESRQQMQYEAAVKIVQAVLIGMFGFFVLFHSPSVMNLGLAYLSASSIALAMFLAAFFFRFRQIRFRINFRIWGNILKMSWPLGLAFAAGLIFVRIDSVMMGYWGQITEVGWYNAAYGIVGALMVPGTIIFLSFLPVLTKMFKESHTRLQDIYDFYRETSLAIAIPLTVGGVILASKLTAFLYGAAYMPSVFAFQLLIAIAGIYFLYSPYAAMLIVVDKQNAILFINLFGAIVNIMLNILLIPRYSLYGAAVATLITYVVVLILAFNASRRNVPLKFLPKNLFKTLTIVILSSTIMLGVIVFPPVRFSPVLWIVFWGVLAYSAALFFFLQLGLGRLNLKHWIAKGS